MGGWDGNSALVYMQSLIDKGVPFYAASQATKSYTRRQMRKRLATTPKRQLLLPTHKSHGTAWCGSCYERSKGR